jgi:hypothetical protein
MELSDVIRAMRDALDLIEQPGRFGPELKVCIRQDLAEAIAAMEQAQREISGHLNSIEHLEA